MSFPDIASPNTFAFWHELAARDPSAAARLFHQRLAAIDEADRRAMFAFVPDAGTLAETFARSMHQAGPLAGVPFVVKDLFSVAGHRIGAGSRFLAERREPEAIDAPLVHELKRQGAVFAGITHLHEFAFGITGENPHFGDGPNPRLPGRVSGGSSSGSVAAVAGGLVPLAIGTDTGGSVRLPAAFCGVWGHRGKPRSDYTADCFPLAPSFDTAGWFTSNRSDLLAVMRSLYPPEPGAMPTRPLARIPSLLLPSDLTPGFAEPVDAAARELAEPLPDDLLREFLEATAASASAFTVIQGVEAAAVHEGWMDIRREDYDPVVWARLDRGRRRTGAEIEDAERTRGRVRAVFGAIFERFAGIVMATSPFPALTKAECTEEARRRILHLTTPASLAGLPALAVPVGLPDGSWGGLQVITPEPLAALALV